MKELLIGIILSALLSAGGTWKYQEYRYAAIDAKRVADKQELKDQQQTVVNVASDAHEATKTIVQTKYVTITETIDNVITKIEYRDRVCFDDDGLRAHASAIELTGAAPKFEAALPTSDTP